MEVDRVGMSTRRTRRPAAAYGAIREGNAIEVEYRTDTEATIASNSYGKSSKRNEVKSCSGGIPCTRNLRNRVQPPQRYFQEEFITDLPLSVASLEVILLLSDDEEQAQMQQQVVQQQKTEQSEERQQEQQGKERPVWGTRKQRSRLAFEQRMLPKWFHKKRSNREPRHQANEGVLRSARRTTQAKNVRVSGTAKRCGKRLRYQGSNGVEDQQRVVETGASIETAPSQGKRGYGNGPVTRIACRIARNYIGEEDCLTGRSMVPTVYPSLRACGGGATPKAEKPVRPRQRGALNAVASGMVPHSGIPPDDMILSQTLPSESLHSGALRGGIDVFDAANVLPVSAGSHQNLSRGQSSDWIANAASIFENQSQSEGLPISEDEYQPSNVSGSPPHPGERNAGQSESLIRYSRRAASVRNAGIEGPMSVAFRTESVPSPPPLSENESTAPYVIELSEDGANGGREKDERHFDLNELPEAESTSKNPKRKKHRPKVLSDDVSARARKPKSTEKKTPKRTPNPKNAAKPRRTKATDCATPGAGKRIPKRRKPTSDATSNPCAAGLNHIGSEGRRARASGPSNGLEAGLPSPSSFLEATFDEQSVPASLLQSKAGPPNFDQIQVVSSSHLSPAKFPSTPADFERSRTGVDMSWRSATFDSPSTSGLATPIDNPLQTPHLSEEDVFCGPTTSVKVIEPSPPVAVLPPGFPRATCDSGPKRKGKKVKRALFLSTENPAWDKSIAASASTMPQGGFQADSQATNVMTTLSLGWTQAEIPEVGAADLTLRDSLASDIYQGVSAVGSVNPNAGGSPSLRLRAAARRKCSDTKFNLLPHMDDQRSLHEESPVLEIRTEEQHIESAVLAGSEENHATGLELAIVKRSSKSLVTVKQKPKKHKPKVILDEDDLRMWKLIMANGAKHYDSADPQAAKWEKERLFLKLRANEFIRRMHETQGDRRFSKWGGSVTDSVVGAFLTQNVTDHLSSSAFMNLASNWPVPEVNSPPNDDLGEADAGIRVEEIFLDSTSTATGDPESLSNIAAQNVKVSEAGDEVVVIMDSEFGKELHVEETRCDNLMLQMSTSIQGNDSVPIAASSDSSIWTSHCANEETTYRKSVSQFDTGTQCNFSVPIHPSDDCGVGTPCRRSGEASSCSANGEEIRGLPIDFYIDLNGPTEGMHSTQDDTVASNESKMATPAELEPPGDSNITAKTVSRTVIDLEVTAETGLVKQSPNSTLQPLDYAYAGDSPPDTSCGVETFTSLRAVSEMEDMGSTGAQLQTGAACGRELEGEETSEMVVADLGACTCSSQRIEDLEGTGRPTNCSLEGRKIGDRLDKMSRHLQDFAKVDFPSSQGAEEKGAQELFKKLIVGQKSRHCINLDDTAVAIFNQEDEQKVSSPQLPAEGSREKLNLDDVDIETGVAALRCYARNVHSLEHNSRNSPVLLNASNSSVQVVSPEGREGRSESGREVELPGKESAEGIEVGSNRKGKKVRTPKRVLTATEIRDLELARTNALKQEIDWEEIRKKWGGGSKEESQAEAEAWANGQAVTAPPSVDGCDTSDSVDWEAVRKATSEEIASAIKERGMNNMLAARIKGFLERMKKEHGTTSLEWVRNLPPEQAKAFLMSIRGLGLKSVECIRLLTLHHHAFPVDTNVGRICVRLGWVPLEDLPPGLQMHNLEMYPIQDTVQKYLWPRLCKFTEIFLYELHYQLITFGKVYCTKSRPNCTACPMNDKCAHFQSVLRSQRGLPEPPPTTTEATDMPEMPALQADGHGAESDIPRSDAPSQVYWGPESLSQSHKSSEASTRMSGPPDFQPPEVDPDWRPSWNDAFTITPIVEEPSDLPDVEDLENQEYEYFGGNPESVSDPALCRTHPEDPDDQNYPSEVAMKALALVSEQFKFLQVPKLKNVGRLRTVHFVYELSDSHPLLKKLKMSRREPDDPSNYLLAIWSPGEEPDKNPQFDDLRKMAKVESDVSNAEETVYATILIPCRTAMKGKFPLNGTYFQVNEVFADHESSINPLKVPRKLIWGLRRRFVYFGTSVTTIFKGLEREETQACFWKGYVCVRGFDYKTKAPKPLAERLHSPASKLGKNLAKRKFEGEILSGEMATKTRRKKEAKTKKSYTPGSTLVAVAEESNNEGGQPEMNTTQLQLLCPQTKPLKAARDLKETAD